jgi:hypothetical protein
MIDLQTVRGGAETEFQRRYAEIKAEWEAAGIIVLDPRTREPLPESIMGIPREAIGGRLRGGGGGIEQEAIHVFTDLWPLVASGFVGAVSADAWNYTKTRVAAALKRLLGLKVQKITIEVADEGSGLRDDMYEFEADDVNDVDRAVDAMVDNVMSRGSVEERRTIEYRWDATNAAWVPVRRVDTISDSRTHGE